MKKALLIMALICMAARLGWAPEAQAQEKGPLAMSVEFQFTLAGIVGGAGGGIFILQRSVIPPRVAVADPLSPSNRITADPMGGRDSLFAVAPPRPARPGVILPVFKMRF